MGAIGPASAPAAVAPGRDEAGGHWYFDTIVPMSAPTSQAPRTRMGSFHLDAPRARESGKRP